MEYDPQRGPDPGEWNRADEDARLEAVSEAHHRAGDRVPNPRLHHAVHVVVETQLAAGEEPTQRALARLMAEGLDRHDAVHAIGTAVAEQMFAVLKQAGAGGGDPSAEYRRRLEALTAEGFRAQGLRRRS